MLNVKWTQGHLDELNKVFPEVFDNAEPNELLLNSGKRTVVNYVRQQLRGSSHKVQHD